MHQYDTQAAARRKARSAPISDPLPERRAALILRNRGERICLDCDKPFDSEGPWNRICKPCATGHLGQFERTAHHAVMDDDE